MTETPRFSLAPLDQPRPVSLDPDILARNLDAVRLWNQPLVERITATELPPDWQPCAGLDDFPTWQVAGQWRCNTTAPWQRAESVASTAGTDQNIALASIGTGAEARRLLARLSRQNAVFIFESDPVALRAVLSLVDLRAELESLRAILLDQQPAAALLDTLRQHPGLMPPQRIIAPAETAAELLVTLRQACEQVTPQILAERQQQLAELQALPPAAKPRKLFLNFLAIHQQPAASRVAREFARAITGSHAAGICDGPAATHRLDLARRLYPGDYENLLTLGPLPEDLPVPAGTRHIAWLLEEPETLPPADILAAGTPELSSTLAARAPDRRRIDLFAAVEPPENTSPPQDVDRFVLCGDRPDLDERRLGIVQPTHRLIWNAAREAAAAALQSGRGLDAETLLKKAERTARVRLELADLRSRMCEIIRRNLIPRLVLETINGTLSESVTPWYCVGSGWPNDRRLGDTLCTLSEPQWNERPLAIIFVGALAPSLQDLLWAAANDWPIVLAQTQSNTTPPAPQIFQPDDLRSVTLTQLPHTLQTLRDDPAAARARAAATSTRLRAAHTWQQRVARLFETLSAPD